MKWIVVALGVIVVAALEGAVELNDHNFDQLVKASRQTWLVMFSTSWCGHCKDLKPEITQLAHLLAPNNIQVGHVNCDTDGDQVNEDLIIDYVMDRKTHQMSYPKLRVFHKGRNKQLPLDLHTAGQILQWLKSNYGLIDPQL